MKRQLIGLLMLLMMGKGAAQTHNTVTPQLYLSIALSYIQNNALNASKVDWSQVMQQANMLGSTAKTPSDTYDFIQQVIEKLGDHHSHFWKPGESVAASTTYTKDAGVHFLTQGQSSYQVYLVEPGSAAQKAGLQPGDKVLDYKRQSDGQLWLRWQHPGNSQIHETTLPTRKMTVPFASTTQSLEQGIVRLALFSNEPAQTPTELSEYAQQIQTAIGQAQGQATCGWILDLRQDPGGSTAAQMLALGPLLDPQAKLMYVPHREQAQAQITTYSNGQVTLHASKLSVPLQLNVPHPTTLKRPVPPLAVLQSRGTASAAEGLLVMLKGRPQTRFFGEPSTGVPTGNIGQDLPDGAHITLTDSVTQDRNGKQYDSTLAPDVTVPTFKNFGTSNDPAIQAAQKWLLGVCKHP